MTVMITGGTGFLGSFLARRLVDQGEKDILLYEQHINEERLEGLRGWVTIVQGDVLDFDKIKSTMQEYRVDRVAHLAFLLTIASMQDPPLATQINCAGAINVFEAAMQSGIKRVVYASSAAVYGGHKALTDDELTEEACPAPNSLYGAAKLYNDHMAGLYAEQHGMEMIGFRPVVILGPTRTNLMTENPANYMNLPELAAKGLPALMPPDAQEMDLIYVADAATAWHMGLALPLTGHQIFNLSAERRTIGEYTRLVQDLEPRTKIKTLKNPVGGLRLVSNEKIRNELGFEPEYRLEDWVPEYLGYVRGRL